MPAVTGWRYAGLERGMMHWKLTETMAEIPAILPLLKQLAAIK